MPTEPMSVFVRTENEPAGKTYAVNLDTSLSPDEWQARYLELGFREPDGGKVIDPEKITTVAVRPITKSRLGSFPAEGALAWLEDQVDQTCRLGLSP